MSLGASWEPRWEKERQGAMPLSREVAASGGFFGGVGGLFCVLGDFFGASGGFFDYG